MGKQLIVIKGGAGCGKSRKARELTGHYEAMGMTVTMVDESAVRHMTEGLIKVADSDVILLCGMTAGPLKVVTSTRTGKLKLISHGSEDGKDSRAEFEVEEESISPTQVCFQRLVCGRQINDARPV